MNRRASAAFAGKQGFITLRDLFRWGERYRLSSSSSNNTFYDWEQHIADEGILNFSGVIFTGSNRNIILAFVFVLEGYLLLAGRVRKNEEAEIVLTALEKHTKKKVDIDRLFNCTSISLSPSHVH